MKTTAVLALIVSSSFAVPIDDFQARHELKKLLREAPGGYYGLPSYAAAAGSTTGAAGYGTQGEVVGVFPHAKTGGCSVPLLLSCSPNVIHGKIVSSYSSPTYKNVEEDLMREVEWMNQMREANRPMMNFPEQKILGVDSMAHHHKTEQTTKH